MEILNKLKPYLTQRNLIIGFGVLVVLVLIIIISLNFNETEIDFDTSNDETNSNQSQQVNSPLTDSETEELINSLDSLDTEKPNTDLEEYRNDLEEL